MTAALPPGDSWQPLANRQTLQQRATLLRAARDFFATRKVLEVETPVLNQHGVTDPHIRSLQLQREPGWLRSSPEYHMKRLLAADDGDLYQIGIVFRAGEAGSRHQPEFTMAEWYRLNSSFDSMVQESCDFIRHLHAAIGPQLPAKFDRYAYRDVFRKYTGVDPCAASLEELQEIAMGVPVWHALLGEQLGSDRHGWLDFIASHTVYPRLPGGTLQVITDYPADQAMLARLRPDDPQSAERFEVFLDGLELANGFHELADAAEQRQRFVADNNRRAAAGLPVMDIDERLLAALQHGLPDCCGVAVGIDRLLMLAGDYRDLAATLSFRPGG